MGHMIDSGIRMQVDVLGMFRKGFYKALTIVQHFAKTYMQSVTCMVGVFGFFYMKVPCQ